MKKIVLTAVAAVACSLSWAQYNTYPYPSTGFIGFGLPSASAALAPSSNLQVHGTTNYFSPTNGFSLGVSSGIRLSNTETGLASADGTIVRQTKLAFCINNLETGTGADLALSIPGLGFGLQGLTGRAYFGSSIITGTNYAQLNNIATGDNGLFIQTTTAGKYGLSIRSNAATDNAIQVIGTSYGALPTFAVKASGATEIHTTSTNGADKIFLVRNVALNKKLLQLTNDGILRAREIIVDAIDWADYVFEPNYNLMPLSEVKSFISENGHLPNVPSTSEINEAGVNLAKTDALLLEKIEELTLYLLQQQEQLKLQNEQLLLMQKEVETLKTGN